MVTLNIQLTTRGPVLEGKGAEVIEREVGKGIEKLVELGEQRLAMMLRSRPAGVYLSVAEARKGQASQGNYPRNIHGMASHLHGLITDSEVEYGPWLEGVGSRNATTRFKGYHSFRRVGQTLQKDAPAILEQYIKKAIAELKA